ncbi:MAG: bifunctional 23S rRNA (guanine(2069)-N(7))-methyltransferase RlmK/23S rRNA (guanine(2445)-N(2))-methyltransferase RlmL [Spirochaetales bacterium]|nr:bifunctional 23S rRNA (guanine(2069)-N(7))-methyltransferase RlmK/23S rRNA (guanine(2445)-N(2))-methyltransferase RlmL [Spirochaetales bacterium]
MKHSILKQKQNFPIVNDSAAPFPLFASCPLYVEDLLEEELKVSGALKTKKTVAGVHFRGNLETAYRVCYCSRISSRVLLHLAGFPVKTQKELYNGVYAVPWIEHFTSEQGFAVDCTLKQGILQNRDYAALVVKDAIADYFRDKAGKRPPVDTENPDIRIRLHMHGYEAILFIDLSGESLHKRGYRVAGSKASLKENAAAAMLFRAGWPELAVNKAAFVDPMCGSGTLLVEAAMIAAGIPAGRFRTGFGFFRWKQHQPEVWKRVVQEAEKQCMMESIGFFRGYDMSSSAIRATRANICQAGLREYIHVEKREIASAGNLSGTEYTSGLVAVNPPYGVRLGKSSELVQLYRELGKTLLTHFPGWKAAVLSSDRELSFALGLRAVKTNYLYNGPLKCLLSCFELREEQVFHTYPENVDEPDEALVNRLKKNLKRLVKWAKRHSISCYRLYDADLPEYNAAIDYYEGKYLHIQEYAPPGTVDKKKARQRFFQIVRAVRQLLGIKESELFLKQRVRQKGNSQYERMNPRIQKDSPGTFYIINERDLKFKVNFTDYIDPGIFLLGRNLRQMIREKSRDKRFLNLFAYTGTATVYAAAGGAAATLSVDTNRGYLQWAEENLALNGFSRANHQFVKQDCLTWLRENREEFDLIFLDPPTFSNTKKKGRIFDLQKQHVLLITLCMQYLTKNGMMIFSSNFKGLKLDLPALSHYRVKDLHKSTLPEDFKQKPGMYHCWQIEHVNRMKDPNGVVKNDPGIA